MSEDEHSGYVSKSTCTARVRALSNSIKGLKQTCDRIKKALVGDDLRSGIVKDIGDLKSRSERIEEKLKDMEKTLNNVKKPSQSSLRGRDYAVILAALITAIASIIVAWVK